MSLKHGHVMGEPELRDLLSLLCVCVLSVTSSLIFFGEFLYRYFIYEVLAYQFLYREFLY